MWTRVERTERRGSGREGGEVIRNEDAEWRMMYIEMDVAGCAAIALWRNAQKRRLARTKRAGAGRKALDARIYMCACPASEISVPQDRKNRRAKSQEKGKDRQKETNSNESEYPSIHRDDEKSTHVHREERSGHLPTSPMIAIAVLARSDQINLSTTNIAHLTLSRVNLEPRTSNFEPFSQPTRTITLLVRLSPS